jgi:hypothetical protein
MGVIVASGIHVAKGYLGWNTDLTAYAFGYLSIDLIHG